MTSIHFECDQSKDWSHSSAYEDMTMQDLLMLQLITLVILTMGWIWFVFCQNKRHTKSYFEANSIYVIDRKNPIKSFQINRYDYAEPDAKCFFSIKDSRNLIIDGFMVVDLSSSRFMGCSTPSRLKLRSIHFKSDKEIILSKDIFNFFENTLIDDYERHEQLIQDAL